MKFCVTLCLALPHINGNTFIKGRKCCKEKCFYVDFIRTFCALLCFSFTFACFLPEGLTRFNKYQSIYPSVNMHSETTVSKVSALEHVIKINIFLEAARKPLICLLTSRQKAFSNWRPLVEPCVRHIQRGPIIFLLPAEAGGFCSLLSISGRNE